MYLFLFFPTPLMFFPHNRGLTLSRWNKWVPRWPLTTGKWSADLISGAPSVPPAVFVKLVTVNWLHWTLWRVWGMAAIRPEVSPLSRSDLSLLTASQWGGRGVHRSILKFRGGGGFTGFPGDIYTDINWLFTRIHTPLVLSVAQTPCVCCQKTD